LKLVGEIGYLTCIPSGESISPLARAFEELASRLPLHNLFDSISCPTIGVHFKTRPIAMLLSQKHKFIFIHVAKVAGQSITSALMPFAATAWQKCLSPIIPYRYQLKAYTKLKQHLGISFMPQPHADHIRAAALREEMGWEVFESYYSFAFVRDPWAWVLSNYTYARRNPRHWRHKLVHAFKDFDEYCRWFCTEDEKIKFQKDYVFDDKGRQVVDFIGKMENIEADFAHICGHLGIRASLPHFNASRHESHLQHYSDELFELVKETFAEDIRLLGYPPNM
jgi:hypothetical protein